MKLIETINISSSTGLVQNGIFNALATMFSALQQRTPFEDWLVTNKDELDNEFYLNHSGDKTATKIVNLLWDKTGYANLPKIIYNHYKIKWERIYNAFTKDYKPLENYDMEQVETPDITKNRTENQNTDVTTSTSSTSENETYGFNSNSPVPSDDNSGTGSNRVTGDKEDNFIESEEKETGTRTLTRHGNIGVTTSQQMLQSEIDLRTKFNFVETIYRDVDSVMCLELYL